MSTAITALLHGTLTLISLGVVGFIGAEYWYDVNVGIQQIGDIDLSDLD